MKYVKVILLLILFFCTAVDISYAMKPDPKRTSATVEKIFMNFLNRPPSSQPYEGAPKSNERKHFKDMLMSASGDNQTLLKQSLQQKIKEMINTLSVRDEYRNKVQPVQWTDKYWRAFITKLQKDFEKSYNPSPQGAINELVSRAMSKRWGPDLKNTQEYLMTFYKDSKYYQQYVNELTDDIIYEPPIKPKYNAILTMTFNRFLARKPSIEGGKKSEVNKFTELLESCKDDRVVLTGKIMELVNILVERNEYRDRAGYADWTIKYWTGFIQLCVKSFEGRDAGPDRDWANKIVINKGKYKNIRNAQDAVINEFKKSDRYKNWAKNLALN